MNAFIHTITTLFFVRFLNLSSKDKFLAFLFGVGPDLDHLIKLPLYLRLHKFKKVKFFTWRTPLQEPISFLWISLLSVYLQSWAPVIFFASHLALDYSMSYTKRPFFPFNPIEIKGISLRIPDKTKEIITFFVFLCLNLFLVSIRK